jgi:hypothetical protein
MKAIDIKFGNIYRITERTKHPTFSKDGQPAVITFDARINWAEDREGFLYFGYTPCGEDSWKYGAWGNAGLYEEPKPFGVQKIEDTGRRYHLTFWTPKPGDPHYDPVH